MSPPCMAAIFDADNGGATTTGVSATEVRIAMPNMSGSATDQATAVVDALFGYFNQRYEFYGRRLVPVYVSGGGATPEAARASAADTAARGVFAAVTGMYERSYEVPSTLLATLANEGVISVARGSSSWLTDRVLYDALHPYAWSVFPSAEDAQRNLGGLACTLVGHRAQGAGDPNLRGRTRTLAVLAAGRQVPATRVLLDGLAACLDTEPLVVQWEYTAGTPALQTAYERLRSANATSVICVCDSWAHTTIFSTAASIGFQPEWVLAPSVLGTGYDEGQMQSNRRSNQLAPPIMLGSGPRVLPIQDRPWFGALQGAGLLASTSLATVVAVAEFVYPELLLLAAGVQGAGPVLDADRFAQALMSTQFPNPGVGGPPYWQPAAGFGPGDHSLYDDYSVGWWSDSVAAVDPASTSPTGSWCYVGQGARYQPGSYPVDTDERLFNSALPCR